MILGFISRVVASQPVVLSKPVVTSVNLSLIFVLAHLDWTPKHVQIGISVPDPDPLSRKPRPSAAGTPGQC